MKSLCINCHQPMEVNPPNAPLTCGPSCGRAYRKLSTEAEKAAFYMWCRELKAQFDYTNDDIGELLQLDLLKEQAE